MVEGYIVEFVAKNCQSFSIEEVEFKKGA